MGLLDACRLKQMMVQKVSYNIGNNCTLTNIDVFPRNNLHVVIVGIDMV